MSAFVEECRAEWRRLGVPDSIADEMASDLEVDLDEASAEGVSATEILGESDPRRFAASWASARGLVPDRRPRRRRSLSTIFAAALAVLIVGMVVGVVLVVEAAHPYIHTLTRQGQQPVGVPVPLLVGLKERQAVALVRAKRLGVAVVRVAHRPAGVVVTQAPSAGARVEPGTTVLLRVGRGA